MAEDVDGEALSTLVVNAIRKTFAVVAVKAPGFGDRRKAMLQDMAVLTGAQVVSAEVGLKLDQVGLEVLGTARRVTVTKEDTTVVDGGGAASDISDRVRQIKAEIEASDSDWDREKLQERLAKLAGGVGVIRVGAATEVELKEKKHRLEDAISATRAAVEEGIVPGGGTALVKAAHVLDGDLGLTGDEATGVGIVRRALVEPLRWIAQNAGQEGYVVVSKVADLPGNEGYNAASDTYGTSSSAASSTRSRSPAPRCRTRRPSPRCSSPPRPSWWRSRPTTTRPRTRATVTATRTARASEPSNPRLHRQPRPVPPRAGRAAVRPGPGVGAPRPVPGGCSVRVTGYGKVRIVPIPRGSRSLGGTVRSRGPCPEPVWSHSPCRSSFVARWA